MIQLPDGKTIRVGYDSTNGQPYRAIGQKIIDEGGLKPEETTLQSIRRWLLSHPKQIDRILYSNPSYVFFRRIHEVGSYGNIGVLLTPWYSIATDHRLFPRGAPAIIKTALPQIEADGETVSKWEPEARFVVNQDTGGAIRGPGRVDWFTGGSPLSEQTAGVMKRNRSALYFIAPNES